MLWHETAFDGEVHSLEIWRVSGTPSNLTWSDYTCSCPILNWINSLTYIQFTFLCNQKSRCNEPSFAVLCWHTCKNWILIVQRKKNALRVSVAGRENISPIILAHTVMIWICTRLQRVIAAENSTACKGYESTRYACANDVILLPENANRMMGLWIRNTPTVFRSPLLSFRVLETFLASREFSGPRVIR